MDTRYIVISCSYITVTHAYHTSVHSCIVSILLSYDSPCILHILFHVTVSMLYDCFLLLIWIFPILDMRAVDMRYVGIPHLLFPFPGILFMLSCSCYIVPDSRDIVPVSCYIVPVISFYAINRAQVQLSCYLYHVQ